MTDKEKLQQLFDAALKAPTDFSSGPPKRATPNSPAAAWAMPAAALAPAPNPPAPVLEPLSDEAAHLAKTAPATAAVPLDKAAAEELGVLLDDQIRRQNRKRRRGALVAATVLFGLTGGGSAWFVQSPDRIEAFTSAVSEIRSVGDVNSMVAKYQAALDRISVRGQQIDHATTAMGVKPGAGDEVDPHMDAEMKEMMGGEGTTVGQRNSALQKSFGNKIQPNGSIPNATANHSEDDFSQ